MLYHIIDIRIYDDKRGRLVRLEIESNNILRKEYFNGIFPYATGIIFDDNDRNELVGIARDENGNFICDWNTDVVYKLVFYDVSSNRSNRSNQNSSITSKIWNWLMLGGSILIMWIGSTIASLWSNLYEDIFKMLSYSQALNTQLEKTYFSIRMILLLGFSTIYVVSMICITPPLITSSWKKIKEYFKNIEMENLRYNASSPVSLNF
ncbi:unnamed protein product [Rotaria socialis]|uniref:Uncharacterized protein n=2 Tax=Rotaria socialis TaxID=392032 RepID=A0A820BCK5_9BILA|nr:unnamed protein product [Rotaria socialis]